MLASLYSLNFFFYKNLIQQWKRALGVLCPTGELRDAAMGAVAAASERLSHQAIRIFIFKIVATPKV
jgi:hypothetical protein